MQRSALRCPGKRKRWIEQVHDTERRRLRAIQDRFLKVGREEAQSQEATNIGARRTSRIVGETIELREMDAVATKLRVRTAQG